MAKTQSTTPSRKGFRSFFSLVVNSMDGHSNRSYSSRDCFVGAVIMLTVWIVLSSLGGAKIYEQAALFQTYWNGMALTSEVGQQLIKQNYLTEEQAAGWSFWPFSSEEEEKDKMSPFLQGLISNVSAVLALIILWLVMMKIAKAQGGWKNCIVAVGACSVPLTVGLIFAYLFFKIGGGAGEDSNPAMWYALGSLSLIIASMTSFIILHVDVLAVLNISGRIRYFTTILSVFVWIGVFAWVTKSLTSS